MPTATPHPDPVPLTQGHDPTAFDCGAPRNDYLHKYALQNHLNRSAFAY